MILNDNTLACTIVYVFVVNMILVCYIIYVGFVGIELAKIMMLNNLL